MSNNQESTHPENMNNDHIKIQRIKLQEDSLKTYCYNQNTLQVKFNWTNEKKYKKTVEYLTILGEFAFPTNVNEQEYVKNLYKKHKTTI